MYIALTLSEEPIPCRHAQVVAESEFQLDMSVAAQALNLSKALDGNSILTFVARCMNMSIEMQSGEHNVPDA